MKNLDSKQNKPHLTIRALLWISPLLLFIWVLISGRAFFWGTPALQFIPWRELAWRELMAGELPLWNALNGMGAPLLANYQLAFWYPPGWLNFLFEWIGGTVWMAWSMTLSLVLHLAWAGYGTARLLRYLHVGELGQVIAGLAFSLCGYLISRAGFSSIIWTAAWMPWVILGLVSLANPDEKKVFRSSFFLPAAFMLLAGHAQTATYIFVLGGVWGLLEALREKKFKGVIRFIGLVVINGCLAIGLAAVQLIPTAEYLIHSQRATAVSFDYAMNYSFWPWHFLNLLSPEFFGNPGLGDYWGFGAYWEDAVYCGLVPLLLAISTIRYFRKKDTEEKIGQCLRPVVLFLWGVIFVTVLLALGENLPIFPWLYRNIPGFDMFQAPARMMIWVVFSIALLAGIGMDGWERPQKTGLVRLKRSTAIFVAVILGTVCVWVVLPNIDASFIRAGIWIGIVGSAACLIALQQPMEAGTIRHDRWQWFALSLVCLDLIAAGFFLNPTVPMSFYYGNTEVGVREGRIWLSSADEYALKFDRFLRFDSFIALEDWENMIEVLLPNSNIYSGQSMVNNFDPMIPGNYTVWIDWVNQLAENDNNRALDLMDVSIVINVDEVTQQVEFIEHSTGSYFWTATCAQAVDSQANALQSLESRLQDDVLPFIIVGEDITHTGTCEINPLPTSNIEINQQANSLTSMTVNMTSAGWLMVSDTMYPGWTATIDGSGAQIHSAYGIFKSVWVEAGRHEIEFRYQPISFYSGLGISLLLSGLLIALSLNKNLDNRLKKITIDHQNRSDE